MRSKEVSAKSSSSKRRAGLEHADPVALLGQPQRADRAAEARADDEDVVVEGFGAVSVTAGHFLPSFFIRRRLAVMNLRVRLVAHAEHRREPDQPLGRDRLRLGVAQDALGALAAAHAGLAHAAHRRVDAGEGRAERLVDVHRAALDLPGDRASRAWLSRL